MAGRAGAWDEEFDVVVVGSGAGGLVAGLAAADAGLSAVVVEKSSRFGGSTARSGGVIWIPNNPVNLRAGLRDSFDRAWAYLAACVGDRVPPERRRAFLEKGPETIAFLESSPRMEFGYVPGYSDYHPEMPGGAPEGRSIEALPIDARLLGDERDSLEPPAFPVPKGVYLTVAQGRPVLLMTRTWEGRRTALLMAWRMVKGRFGRKDMVALGQSLVARLRLALRDARVPMRLETPLVRLVVEDGVVTGAVVRSNGVERTLRARTGVVLASGGFEHNAEMRDRFQPHPITTEWTLGAASNTGDGINAGVAVGAAVDLMDDAWWGPTVPLPEAPYFCLQERSLPGTLMVNGAGVRFTNEAAPYVNVVHAMYEGQAGGVEHVPSWFVFDSIFGKRYMLCGLKPRQKIPQSWFDAGVAHRSDTIEGLARSIGVPVEALTATVERFNGSAREGQDPDFGRGTSAYDRYYGDPTIRPNPCLGPIDKPPYYAVKMVPGDLGTKGGLVCDEHSRVLREDGSVIEGLYATGNCSAAVMGHDYAGAGATIGPAMVFGYIASRHAALRAADVTPASS